MTPYLRSVRAYLRDAYGVRDAALEPGGKHPHLAFSYAGSRHRLTIQNPTNDRGGAAAFKRRDLRRLLGPPPDATTIQTKRRLEDMMPASIVVEARAAAPTGYATPPIEERAYAGHVSLTMSPSSPNPRLRVQIPDALYRAFGHTGGLTVRRVGADEFEVLPRPSVKRPCFLPVDRSTDADLSFASEKAVSPPLPPEARFGSSPAECVLVDGHILVRVTERRPVKQMRAALAEQSIPVTAKEKTQARAYFSDVSSNVLIAPSADPAAALALIRRVEAETPYRLIRVKDEAGGHWAFSAPRIE